MDETVESILDALLLTYEAAEFVYLRQRLLMKIREEAETEYESGFRAGFDKGYRRIGEKYEYDFWPQEH